MTEIDDLPNKPGHLIRLAHQRAIAVFSEATLEFNITAVQHVIMVALEKYPGVDLSNLAQIVGLDRSTTGNVAARLSDRGIIAIKPSEIDRRAKLLRLTQKGETLLDAMLPSVRLSQENLLGSLSEAERSDFFRILQKISGKAYPRPQAERTRSHVAAPPHNPAHKAYIDQPDSKIGRELRGYIHDIESRAAIFPRSPEITSAGFSDLVEDFSNIRQQVLEMSRSGAHRRFIFVLAFSDVAALANPVAMGMKHTWIELIRNLYADLNEPEVDVAAFVWVPPEIRNKRKLTTAANLAQRMYAGLGELTRFLVFDGVDNPGLTILVKTV